MHKFLEQANGRVFEACATPQAVILWVWRREIPNAKPRCPNCEWQKQKLVSELSRKTGRGRQLGGGDGRLGRKWLPSNSLVVGLSGVFESVGQFVSTR